MLYVETIFNLLILNFYMNFYGKKLILIFTGESPLFDRASIIIFLFIFIFSFFCFHRFQKLQNEQLVSELSQQAIKLFGRQISPSKYKQMTQTLVEGMNIAPRDYLPREAILRLALNEAFLKKNHFSDFKSAEKAAWELFVVFKKRRLLVVLYFLDQAIKNNDYKSIQYFNLAEKILWGGEQNLRPEESKTNDAFQRFIFGFYFYAKFITYKNKEDLDKGVKHFLESASLSDLLPLPRVYLVKSYLLQNNVEKAKLEVQKYIEQLDLQSHPPQLEVYYNYLQSCQSEIDACL